MNVLLSPGLIKTGGLNGGVTFRSSGPRSVLLTTTLMSHSRAGAGDDGSLRTVMLK